MAHHDRLALDLSNSDNYRDHRAVFNTGEGLMDMTDRELSDLRKALGEFNRALLSLWFSRQLVRLVKWLNTKLGGDA